MRCNANFDFIFFLLSYNLWTEISRILLFILLALVPARYILAILGSVAMAIVYGLKVNLSVAMVAMLNHTAIKLLSSDSHKIGHVLTANLTAAAAGVGDECASDSTSSAAIEVNLHKL